MTNTKKTWNMQRMRLKSVFLLLNIMTIMLGCPPGWTEDNFIFDDEAGFLTLLAKSEGKKNDDDGTYEPANNGLWETLSLVWELGESFVGNYREDHQILTNSLEEEGKITCWMDKYSTTVFIPEYQHWRGQGSVCNLVRITYDG